MPYKKHDGVTSRAHTHTDMDDHYKQALQAWRMEAFENTVTYSNFESYLIVHLDKMINSFFKSKLGNHHHSVSRQEQAILELKAFTLALDHRCWWFNQKLRAIKEARRLQEEQEEA